MYVSKCYSGINYDFQPTSYWSPGADPLAVALRNIKGRNRREMIQDFYNSGRLEVLSDELLSDRLDEDHVRGILIVCRDVVAEVYILEPVGEAFLDRLPTVDWSCVRDEKRVLGEERSHAHRVVVVKCLIKLLIERDKLIA